MNINKHRAFTLAEVLMVMLVLSIIMAAFAPMMTTRNKVDLGNPWKFAANNSDIYYGIGTSQTAIIGQKEVKTSDPKSRLVISTASDDQSHILFKKLSEVTGELSIDKNKNIKIINLSQTRDSTPYSNIAIGTNVVPAGSFSTYANIGIGENILTSENPGSGSIAIGTDVMPVSTGNNNIGIGKNTLKANTTGRDNVVIGNNAAVKGAGGQNNVVIGNSAFNNKNSNYNTAIGDSAMGNADYSAGNYNTAVGQWALYNAKGTNNTAVGVQACSQAMGSNRICIGANSGPPWMTDNASNADEQIYIGSKALYNNADAALYILNTANGSTRINTANTWVAGNLYVKGVQVTTSDKRLKNIKGENKSGLGQIRELRVFDYTLKDDKSKTPRVGVIAQDLQKIFPDAVGKTEEGFLSVRQEDIFFAMVNALKEMDTYVQGLITETKNILAKIKDINTRITAQDEKIKSLEKQNAELEARIQKLEAKIK